MLSALQDKIEKARARSATARAAAGAAAQPARAPSLADPDDPFGIPPPDEAALEDEILALGARVLLSGVKVMAMMRAFGIAHTKDTPVGDAMLR